MGAGKTAVDNAKKMIAAVAAIAGKVDGVSIMFNVKSGQTIWGTARRIKVVLTRGSKQLGVDCICQDGEGSANIKFFGKALDVKNWPIPGKLVYTGEGFKKEFNGVMDSYGAIPIERFEEWVRAYFQGR